MAPKDKTFEYVLKLNLPRDQKDLPGLKTFTSEGFLQLTKDKKVTSIDVGETPWDERTEYVLDRKFHFITQEVERMQFTHDTSSVLKVSLGPWNTYGDFVRLITRARIYDIRRYALIGDCFYYLPNLP